MAEGSGFSSDILRLLEPSPLLSSGFSVSVTSAYLSIGCILRGNVPDSPASVVLGWSLHQREESIFLDILAGGPKVDFDQYRAVHTVHFTISGQSHDLQQMDPDGLHPGPVAGDPVSPL